jgi:hypothetical protein
VDVYIKNDTGANVQRQNLAFIWYFNIEGEQVGGQTEAGLMTFNTFLDASNNGGALLSSTDGSNLAQGSELKTHFGYHANNWTAQDVNDDFSWASCSDASAAEVLLCYRVGGQWYKVAGGKASYDDVGCGRF